MVASGGGRRSKEALRDGTGSAVEGSEDARKNVAAGFPGRRHMSEGQESLRAATEPATVALPRVGVRGGERGEQRVKDARGKEWHALNSLLGMDVLEGRGRVKGGRSGREGGGGSGPAGSGAAGGLLSIISLAMEGGASRQVRERAVGWGSPVRHRERGRGGRDEASWPSRSNEGGGRADDLSDLESRDLMTHPYSHTQAVQGRERKERSSSSTLTGYDRESTLSSSPPRLSRTTSSRLTDCESSISSFDQSSVHSYSAAPPPSPPHT